jgi:hypothetical protein
MAMDLLNQLAGSRLPVTLFNPVEIDQVRLLRAAGLVIALTPAASDPLALAGTAGGAQVLAITQKGREELARFSYPGDQPPTTRGRLSWWKARVGWRGDSNHRT